MPGADDLAAFIADLRGRLGSGELANLEPIDPGNHRTLADVEPAVWVLPADGL